MVGRHQRDHRDAGGQRERGAREPHCAPVVQQGDQRRRHRDAGADAREVHCTEAPVAGRGEAVEHQGRGEDQAEGAREAGDEAQHRQRQHRARQPHRDQCHDVHHQRGDQPGAVGAGQAHRRQQGAGEIAHEIRGGDDAGLALGQPEGLDHRRQDRGVDKAADADRGGHRQQSADCQREGTFVHGCRAVCSGGNGAANDLVFDPP